MRKIITTLYGIVGLLALFSIPAIAQTQTKDADILVPLHVGAKGWMQALAEQGYKPGLACKLRYADGRLVNGAEAWHSPDIVYITFAKETKVGRAELAKFLKDTSGSRSIPVIGEPFLAKRLEQKPIKPVDPPAKKDERAANKPTEKKEQKDLAPQPGKIEMVVTWAGNHKVDATIYSSIIPAAFIALILIRRGRRKQRNSQPLPINEVGEEVAVSESTKSVEDIEAGLLFDREVLADREQAVN